METKIEEKKVTPQAPAKAEPEKKEEKTTTEQKPEVVPPKPTGLDGMTKDQLKELYSKSPELFEGIAPKVEEKKPEEKKPDPEPKPQSAAPVVLGGVEIKLPSDVPINRYALESRLKLAAEVGLTAVQFQRQLDFEVQEARAEFARQQTPEQKHKEADAANVAALRADKDFGGAKYDENMEIARKGAVKYAKPEMLERLKTSDPVLVRHFWELGKADAEDKTTRAPNRSGSEQEEAEKTEEAQLRSRYPKTPQMRGAN